MHNAHRYQSLLQFQGIEAAIKFASGIPCALSEDGEWVKIPGRPGDEININHNDVIRRDGTMFVQLNLHCLFLRPDNVEIDAYIDKVVTSLEKGYNKPEDQPRYYHDVCFKFPYHGKVEDFGMVRSFNQLSEYDIVKPEHREVVCDILTDIFAKNDTVAIRSHARRYPKACDEVNVYIAGVKVPGVIYPYIQVILASFPIAHPYKGYTLTTPGVWSPEDKEFKFEDGFVIRLISDTPDDDYVYILDGCIIPSASAKTVFCLENGYNGTKLANMGNMAMFNDKYGYKRIICN